MLLSSKAHYLFDNFQICLKKTKVKKYFFRDKPHIYCTTFLYYSEKFKMQSEFVIFTNKNEDFPETYLYQTPIIFPFMLLSQEF
ncbi:hypothetical protein CVT25_008943 [Psilocybe cyanescens]|uniref:Uncharacterized protein n=1 Tax=Psilocybe cyanescens TaxID=93625 RepID=A0A409XNC0_PSICY|nr:hypothetical protein CVT25_008943 [Psilocybe cyanescens]